MAFGAGFADALAEAAVEAAVAGAVLADAALVGAAFAGAGFADVFGAFGGSGPEAPNTACVNGV